MTKAATRTESKTERRLIKALSHPLRYRILEKLNERQASPSVLAEQLDEPLGNVSYHVKVLLENDAIELVETRPVRGALEHVYRATSRPFFDDKQWARLPMSIRREFQNATIAGIWDHLVEAADRGGFNHPETHVTWTTLDLDDQGYQEVVALLNQTLERALQIHAESAGRLVDLPRESRQTERTELTILHYHRPTDEQKASEPKPSSRKRPKRRSRK